MSRVARSILAFGIYCVAVGALLVAGPNLFLRLVGLPPAPEVFIRVLGVVVLTLGLYYIAAARSEVTAFFRWTVWGRPFAFAAFLALVVLGLAPPVLILFGAIDLAGALWTARALRGTRPAPPA